MSVAVGQPAPQFSLRDQNKEIVTLDDLKGNKALIVFIPFPFTGICDNEGCAIRDGLGGLDNVDAKVVIITAHSIPTNAKWASENAFTFPVLSDYWPHGEVAQAYNNFNTDLGCAMRTTFVLDEDGIVREIIASGSLGVHREFETYEKALAAV